MAESEMINGYGDGLKPAAGEETVWSSEGINGNDNNQPCADSSDKSNNLPIKKLLWGILIILGVAVSWVGATQFAKEAYSPDFDGPFFLTWFATCWLIVCFPASIFISSVVGYGKNRSSSNADYGSLSVEERISTANNRNVATIRSTISSSFLIYGPNGITLVTFCTRIFLFCFMWLLTNYLYLKALSYLHPLDVTALFVSNTAFVYLLSIIFLAEKFNIIRFVSVAFSITGVVLLAYVQTKSGFQFSDIIGVCLAVVAAFVAALYQVLFKKIIGNSSDFNQVALFLSMIGACNITIMLPVMLTFYYTHLDKYEWASLPWTFLVGSSALQLVFNFLVNFGVAFTFPLFIAVGTFLGIPLNAVVDFAWRHLPFTALTAVGAVMVCIGFCLMLFPVSWNRQLVTKMCPWMERGNRYEAAVVVVNEDGENNEEELRVPHTNNTT